MFDSKNKNVLDEGSLIFIIITIKKYTSYNIYEYIKIK